MLYSLLCDQSVYLIDWHNVYSSLDPRQRNHPKINTMPRNLY